VLTVGRQIGEVLERHRGLLGAAAGARALSLLMTQVGIPDPARRLDEYPFQLLRRHEAARHDRHGPGRRSRRC
jgi:peptide/nickel transport system ATP-binding protein